MKKCSETLSQVINGFLYVQEPPKKISRDFAFTKEFLKNTKDMHANHFCSHLRQEGQIDLISSPDCYIFIGVSEEEKPNGHL